MLKNKKTIAPILLSFILMLLLWEFYPQEKEVKSFTYNQTESQTQIEDSLRQSSIIGARWELEYPKQVELGDESSIILEIEPRKNIDNRNRNEEDNTITIVTKLETNGGVLTPGQIIYTAYDPTNPTAISWSVLALSGEIKSKLWIYVNQTDVNKQDHTTPLFVIPFEIQVATVFGMKPRHFRLVVFISIIVLFFIVLIVKSPRPK